MRVRHILMDGILWDVDLLHLEINKHNDMDFMDGICRPSKSD